MAILFVSDIHLSPQRPTIVRAFLLFLSQRAHQAEALYILGDLFEAWIGDDDPSELAVSIKRALKQLSDSGVRIYIQKGNRDFTLGSRFAKETGVSLLPDEYMLSYLGHNALLMHGDSLCTDDIDYQRFRRKSRHPIYLWCLLHLPLILRQKSPPTGVRKAQPPTVTKPARLWMSTPMRSLRLCLNIMPKCSFMVIPIVPPPINSIINNE